MSIRTAQWTDLDAINEILTRAFYNESVCGDIMHPHRESYPDDVVKYWRGKTRMNYWLPNEILMVATDNEDRVVGVADWTMKGSKQSRLSAWDPRNSLERVVGWYNTWELWLWPNRAADPATADIFERAFPHSSHFWQGRRADGYCLDLLAVTPRAQKRGYGKLLVEWGLDRAKQEGLSASVISSFGSDPFYLKCGFQEIVGNATEGEGNPLNECQAQGGNILFVDP